MEELLAMASDSEDEHCMHLKAQLQVWKLKQNRVPHLALLELELVELLLDVEEVDPVVRRGELRVQRADRLQRCYEEVKTK